MQDFSVAAEGGGAYFSAACFHSAQDAAAAALPLPAFLQPPPPRLPAHPIPLKHDITSHKGHAAPVSAVQCDEHRVVSAASDGTVSVWDVRTGEELFQIYGHEGGGVNSLQFDREHLVTDGAVCLSWVVGYGCGVGWIRWADADVRGCSGSGIRSGSGGGGDGAAGQAAVYWSRWEVGTPVVFACSGCSG